MYEIHVHAGAWTEPLAEVLEGTASLAYYTTSFYGSMEQHKLFQLYSEEGSLLHVHTEGMVQVADIHMYMCLLCSASYSGLRLASTGVPDLCPV